MTVNLEFIEGILKESGLLYRWTNNNKNLYVHGKYTAYLKPRTYGVLFKRKEGKEWIYEKICTTPDLDKALEIIQGKPRETRLQERILSLLAIENKLLSLEDVGKSLGVDSSALVQARRFLKSKDLITEDEKGLTLLKLNREYKPKTCKFLITKNNQYYCPIKRHIIGNKIQCNCVQDYKEDKIFYVPYCSGWFG